MGLFFKGREILQETVIKHLFDGEFPYDTSMFEIENLEGRVWVWTNLRTGKVIITGDEGNSWQVELAIGINRQDALKKYLRRKERWTGLQKECTEYG